MSDIFISYSRKDSTQALTLAERLRANGMSVWIDRHGLELASSWSREIVEAIEQCRAFMLLLSEHALASKNVIREVTIATDCGRSILPVEIKHVRLTTDFKYALAGLQRAPIQDFDAILRSLAKLGVGSVVEAAARFIAPDKPPAKAVEAKPRQAGRKTLLVLPFVDLSESRDQEWFADGLTEELIDTLSNIKSIRVVDRRTAMEFKSSRGSPADIARDFGIRYFIEGSVRRAGDAVKITAQLLDIEESEYLSALSHKGTLQDIFQIQEDVARKIATALELKLTREESHKLSLHETKSVEAFELYIESRNYYYRQSKESIEHAIEMLDRALALDPHFFEAVLQRAHFQLDFYRLYGTVTASLETIQTMLLSAIAERPKNPEAHVRLGYCYQLQQRFEEGEREAKRAIELDPDSKFGPDMLAFLYSAWGRTEDAARIYEESMALHVVSHRIYFNLYVLYSSLGDAERVRSASERGIPEFERWLRLHPDDFYERVSLCSLLIGCGREDDAKTMANELRASSTANGKAFYNLGCVYLDLQDYDSALSCLARAIDAGFYNPSLTHQWKDNDELKENALLDALIERMERQSAQDLSGTI